MGAAGAFVLGTMGELELLLRAAEIIDAVFLPHGTLLPPHSGPAITWISIAPAGKANRRAGAGEPSPSLARSSPKFAIHVLPAPRQVIRKEGGDRG